MPRSLWILGLVAVLALLASPLFAGGQGEGATSGERPTIKYMIEDAGRTQWTNDVLMMKMISEHMGGVNFEIIAVPGGEATAKFNTMIAGGDIPDFIKAGLTYDTVMQYGGRLFYPVNQKYASMPELTKIRQKYPDYDRMMKHTDGNTYALAYVVPFDYFGGTTIMVDPKLLSQIGVNYQKDLDSWDAVEAMMKKAKAQWPQNYPFITRRGGQGTSSLGIFFGTSDAPKWYVNASTKDFAYGPVEDNFKKMVTYLAKWYKAGLMHPDWFSIKEEVWRELAANQKSVITVDHFSQGFALGGLDENKKERTWEPILAPKLDGTRYFTTDARSNVDPSQLGALSAKTKYADRILKYVDWAYTDQAAEEFVFGKEGYASIRDKEGNLQWKTPMDKFKWPSLVYIDENGKNWSLFELGLLGYTHWFRTWEGFLYYTSKNLMVWTGSSPQIVEWSASKINWYKTTANAPATPTFQIPADKQNRLKDLKVQIETATDEAIVQFIKGTRPLSEWDSYVKTLKSMGLDEALAIYRDAYKAYMAK